VIVPKVLVSRYVSLKGKPTLVIYSKKIIGPIIELIITLTPGFLYPDILGSGKDMVDRLSTLSPSLKNQS
jgi:hypothetical protein